MIRQEAIFTTLFRILLIHFLLKTAVGLSTVFILIIDIAYLQYFSAFYTTLMGLFPLNDCFTRIFG